MRRITKSAFTFLAIACVVVAGAQTNGLNVTASSAIVIEAENGKVLWSKDPDTPRCPASTTKIMTALLLLEHCEPDEIITAPHDVDKVEESSLHLVPGEKVTVSELLYALMLRSANDACYAIAVHISGSVEAFAKLMNERAKGLGCVGNQFCNPNGLPNPKHKVSARDLAMIAREAMKRKDFQNAVRTKEHTIVRSTNQEDTLLVNGNRWLKLDSTADGIKTGWTRAAGHCYVGSATRNGFRTITVVLKSKDWVTDNKHMLGWTFKFHENRRVAEARVEIARWPVSGGTEHDVAVAPLSDVHWVVRKTAPLLVPPTLESLEEVAAPIKAGDPVGTFIVRDDKGNPIRIPVVALANVAASPKIGGMMTQFIGTAGVVLVLGGGALFFRRKAVRMGRSIASSSSILGK